MQNKKLYTVYDVKHIPGIWDLAEKEYPSSKLVGVETCPNKQMTDYTVWVGSVNYFIKGKKYIKYQIKISNTLSEDIANTYKYLIRKGFNINTVIEHSKNKEYLDIYYIYS